MNFDVQGIIKTAIFSLECILDCYNGYFEKNIDI